MDRSYDVNIIFSDMEQELIENYKKIMERGSTPRDGEFFDLSYWQAKKLNDLKEYRSISRQIINKHTRRAVDASTGMIVDNYKDGKHTSNAIISGFKQTVSEASFGRMDYKKMDALIDAVTNDFTNAGSSALRLVDDKYRQIVFKAQAGYTAGTHTLPEAIDLAADDFLSQGINSITYSNGAKVNISSYSEMVMRTSSKRASLAGEGAQNAEMEIFHVQITQYGACSDTCLPYQGRVFVDDVFAGGQPDGVYPLLSEAMAGGLFHPNCRHISQPFFDGISQPPRVLGEEAIRNLYKQEQRQRAIERHIRKYKRLEAGSVDPANRAAAAAKVKAWQAEMRKHLEANPDLRRDYTREKIR